MDDSEGVQTSLEEVLEMWWKRRERWNGRWSLKRQMNCCNFMVKLDWIRSCFSWMNKESFLKENLLLIRAVEMTTKDLEWHINLVDEAVVGLRGLIPNLKKVLLRIKCCQSALHAIVKLFVKGRVNPCGKLHCYFKKLSQPPPPWWASKKNMTCWRLRRWPSTVPVNKAILNQVTNIFF